MKKPMSKEEKMLLEEDEDFEIEQQLFKEIEEMENSE